ncbi:membrane protein [Longimycelium tulufanense]|uniref:Membrane protein n=1 Tax=Longimycelium tulufanense TaxID=907463 RepID=A0A8J3CHM1_9PSEU|nr:DUF4307 domain-containing protein [Longimycelium tulufanense]GGM68796.1 membrane protein [Longimycelium tulufanense]
MAEIDDSTPPGGSPAALADRYGRRAGRRGPRWLYPVLLGVVVVIGAVVSFVTYRNLGPPPIEGKQVAFRVIADDRVEISFEVRRDRPRDAAFCIVRARAQDGDEAGRKEVLVAPGERQTVTTTLLRTAKRAVTGEVFGCSYQVPAYLSSEPRPSG